MLPASSSTNHSLSKGSTMTSTSIYQDLPLSYVYRLDHPSTGEFYFGLRTANKLPASQDLGFEYFTSSKYVKPRFDEFNHTIIQEFVDPLEAYDLEQFLIYQELKNPLLLNRRCHYGKEQRFTFSDKKHSRESKDKISASGTGKKRSQETKRKMRKPKSDEHKKNISLGSKGLTKSDEHKKNLSLAATGRILSEETKHKMSNTRKGAIRGPMRIVECPHCFLSGGVANMKRWHFDNCKFINLTEHFI